MRQPASASRRLAAASALGAVPAEAAEVRERLLWVLGGEAYPFQPALFPSRPQSLGATHCPLRSQLDLRDRRVLLLLCIGLPQGPSILAQLGGQELLGAQRADAARGAAQRWQRRGRVAIRAALLRPQAQDRLVHCNGANACLSETACSAK